MDNNMNTESLEATLKDMGLRAIRNDSDMDDTLLVIRNLDDEKDEDEDDIAAVWGDVDNPDWDCAHPSDFIEYSSDDEQGVCPICGATCEWHWAKAILDDYPDSIREVEVRKVDEWHEPSELSALLGKCLAEISE